ncbi:tRNA pseudouridine(38-40) synthase TruA [Rhizohabitans arisaemae]|uniref:tRNA pseudouridine(38-40) synthase TruA n=1 Tax=Rhizohabitans arisaemae TaxID=2720610 RepID=UPI0024B139E0|nr:tRNA pseudouridine(38-40) synthase TruA [Rhizohabitans arisaemae]
MEDTPSVRLRLDLAYDGTDFSGWARQPDRRTVQGVVEAALGRILRLEAPQLTVAGRTDAGVHARGQVAHVDVPAEAPVEGLVRRLAGVLPSDVRVHRVGLAPEGFDARFSALSRRYCYRVCDRPGGVDPLRRHEVLWHPRPLDLDLMNAAAGRLLGEHDFAAYCKPKEGATTIRELQHLRWSWESPGIAGMTVVADAFCRSMVRALTGAMLAVGDGRRPAGWPAEVLAACVRDSAVNVAPAHGLTLEEVRYPGEAELARRAEETRGIRTLTVGRRPPREPGA